MGFVRDRRTARITWSGEHPLAGLEIRSRVPSTAVFAQLASALSALGGMSGTLDPDPARQQAELHRAVRLMGEVRGLFCEQVISWNYEIRDDDASDPRPVPPTPAGLEADVTDEELIELVAAWLEQIGGAAGPKETPSPGGLPPPRLQGFPMTSPESHAS